MAKGKRPAVGSGLVPWNLQELHEEKRAARLAAILSLAGHGTAKSDVEIDQALKLSTEEKDYFIKRAHFVNEEPIAVVTSYLPDRILAA